MTAEREKGEWSATDLPKTWEWAPFADVFEDKTSTEKKVKQGDYLGVGALPVVDQGQALVGGFTNDTTRAYIGPLPAIVFGDHTRCVKLLDHAFAQGADGVRVLIPTAAVTPEYAYLALRTLRLPDKGYSRHFKFLKASEFPVPPVAEQKRIVAKLDELTARNRRAKEALDTVPPLLDKLRQSILAAAFRGDLTADWRAKNPNVEPTAPLLNRIRAERRSRWEAAELNKMAGEGRAPVSDKWKGRYKEPAPVDTGELELDLPSIPASWTWTTLGHLAWSVKDGPHFSPKYSESGVPFISGGNVRPDGVDFTSVKYISPELHAELAQRCVPEQGDLLYTKGGTTGIARVNTYSHAFNVWVHVAVLKLVPSVDAFFLQHALNSPFCYLQAQRYTHGVGNQDLGLTRMVRIALPLPPRKEQEELIRRIDLAMGALGRRSHAVGEVQQHVQRLERAILEKAFRGELVPQAANDEPASVLLERIRAARNSAGVVAGSRRRSRNAREADEKRGEVDNDGGGDTPAPPLDRMPDQRTTRDINAMDQDDVLNEVFAALWTRGPLEKDDAVRRVAEHLRGRGLVEFQRLRADGPLYAQVLDFIEAAVKAGRLDRPKRGQVRACKPDATTFTGDDWRLSLVSSLGPEPTEREDAIRAAAEWARDNLGLDFSRLRSDGHIVEGLRSAINSAIRRGEVVRYGASKISRAPAVDDDLSKGDDGTVPDGTHGSRLRVIARFLTPRFVEDEQPVVVIACDQRGADDELARLAITLFAEGLSIGGERPKARPWTFYLGIDRPHVEELSTWLGFGADVPVAIVDHIQQGLQQANNRVARGQSVPARDGLLPILVADGRMVEVSDSVVDSTFLVRLFDRHVQLGRRSFLSHRQRGRSPLGHLHSASLADHVERDTEDAE